MQPVPKARKSTELQAARGAAVNEATEVASGRAELHQRHQSKHVPALDGLRGAAVLAVLFYHFGGGASSNNRVLHGLGLLEQGGWSGVTLFFVLSGFLITGILWDSKGQRHWWRNFLMRRVLRIFPLYYATLLLDLVVAIALRHWEGLQYLLIPALFVQNLPGLAPHVAQIPTPFAHFHYWTVAVEEQFYLLWPLLLYKLKTRRQAFALCIGLVGLSLGFRIYVQIAAQHPAQWSEVLLARGGELAMGGALAMVYRSRWWEALESAAWSVAAGSLMVIGVVAWHAGTLLPEGAWPMTLGLLAFTVLMAAVIVLSLRPGPVQRVASWGWLRWVGRISYGLYLLDVYFYHQYEGLTALLIAPANHNLFLAARLVVMLVCSLALAWLSHRFLEQPFLRLKRCYSTVSATG